MHYEIQSLRLRTQIATKNNWHKSEGSGFVHTGRAYRETVDVFPWRVLKSSLYIPAADASPSR